MPPATASLRPSPAAPIRTSSRSRCSSSTSIRPESRSPRAASSRAAAAKVFCSEAAIAFLKDAMVLWGGRGYETADSKRSRGETAFPIEQLVRDAELYRIGEGATDILIPFIAREVLAPHLNRVKDA